METPRGRLGVESIFIVSVTENALGAFDKESVGSITKVGVHSDSIQITDTVKYRSVYLGSHQLPLVSIFASLQSTFLLLFDKLDNTITKKLHDIAVDVRAKAYKATIILCGVRIKPSRKEIANLTESVRSLNINATFLISDKRKTSGYTELKTALINASLKRGKCRYHEAIKTVLDAPTSAFMAKKTFNELCKKAKVAEEDIQLVLEEVIDTGLAQYSPKCNTLLWEPDVLFSFFDAIRSLPEPLVPLETLVKQFGKEPDSMEFQVSLELCWGNSIIYVKTPMKESRNGKGYDLRPMLFAPLLLSPRPPKYLSSFLKPSKDGEGSEVAQQWVFVSDIPDLVLHRVLLHLTGVSKVRVRDIWRQGIIIDSDTEEIAVFAPTKNILRVKAKEYLSPADWTLFLQAIEAVEGGLQINGGDRVEKRQVVVPRSKGSKSVDTYSMDDVYKQAFAGSTQIQLNIALTCDVNDVAPDLGFVTKKLCAVKDIVVVAQKESEGKLKDEVVTILTDTSSMIELSRRNLLLRRYTQSNFAKYRGISTSPKGLVFVKQERMHKIMLKKKWSWKQRIAGAIQLANGLHILHSQNPPLILPELRSWVVRASLNKRDKPEVKIGISQARYVYGEPLRSILRISGNRFRFNPPEVINSNLAIDQRANIYSLGILLWEIAKWDGSLPFSSYKEYLESEKEEELKEKELQNQELLDHYRQNGIHIKGNVAVVQTWDNARLMKAICNESLRPAITDSMPPGYVKIMKRCWSGNVDRRPNMHEVIKALEGVSSKLKDNRKKASLRSHKD